MKVLDFSYLDSYEEKARREVYKFWSYFFCQDPERLLDALNGKGPIWDPYINLKRVTEEEAKEFKSNYPKFKKKYINFLNFSKGSLTEQVRNTINLDNFNNIYTCLFNKKNSKNRLAKFFESQKNLLDENNFFYERFIEAIQRYDKFCNFY